MKANRSLFATKAHRTPPVIVLPQGESRAAGVAPRKRPMRKRLAVLLAAIAVPAMAAPGDFGALPGAAPSEAELVSERLSQQMAESPPMSFERPGMSFPGSAFFFLEDPTATEALIALPTLDATDSEAEAGRELGQMIDAGPAARPFFSASGSNHARALECLAQAVWYEAASESEAGQRAVAQVVLNRVSHPSWPGSVCGVVYQGSQRSTGCQFTFTCDGSMRRRPSGSSWTTAQRIAGEALAGSVYAPVGHATHYHTIWISPYWASSLDHVGTIGAHRFYRNRGSAGDISAFTGGYAGVEPGVSERITAPPAREFDTASTPELPETAARGSARPEPAFSDTTYSAPEPVLADPSYSASGRVRDDYARSGQWLSDDARAALQAEDQSAAEDPTAGQEE